LDRLMGGRTVIAIAHRLSSLRNSIGSSCCKQDGSAKTVRRRCWCKAKASIATWCGKRWHGGRNRLLACALLAACGALAFSPL
jgi:hypothetical protein